MGFSLGVGVFWLEFGSHGRGEDTSLEVFGGDDTNDFNGEVVAYVDDSSGKDLVLLSEVVFQSLDMSAEVLDRGGRGGFGVGNHCVHLGVERSETTRQEKTSLRVKAR